MRRSHRLGWALGLNLGLVAAQAVAGLVASSLGLLADAGHNLADVAALGLALVAVRYAGRPPTARRSFGFHRSGVVAAQVNAAVLLLVTAGVAFGAIDRLLHPVDVRGGLVLVVALVAAAGNAVATLVLRPDADDHNMRAVLLHTAGDAAASLGVALAGGLILLTHGNSWLDPTASLIVAVVLAWHAARLLHATTDVLLESTPRGLDVPALRALIARTEGVEDVHDLHVWSLSGDVHALSAHVVVAGHPTLEEAAVVGERVKTAIAGPYAIAHATLELECESCAPPGAECDMDGLVIRGRPA